MSFKFITRKTNLFFYCMAVLSLSVIVVPQQLQASQGNEFVEHLEVILPELLENYDIPGVAIGVIDNGSIVFQKGFGLSGAATGHFVSPATVFNIGSISKVATAWGVQHLVTTGSVDLDVPIENYIGVLDDVDTKIITLRHLLSHTAGLNLPAVPEYSPNVSTPSLRQALTDLHQLEDTTVGEKFNYSGGGYMLAQHVIETVTGLGFNDFMKKVLFDPVGMKSSSFEWTDKLLEKAAIPYDNGKQTEYFEYTGAAAASMNSSLEDMGKWLLKWIDGDATVEAMMAPQPNAIGTFGIKRGLAFESWGTANGNDAVGHRGQNTGWGAMAFVIPNQNSGVIVLTNSSDGRDLWKWVFCDFLYWKTDSIYRGMCDPRPEFLSPRPPSEKDLTANKLQPIVESYLEPVTNGPGGVTVRVFAGGQNILYASSGLADASTGRLVEENTPFYLASVAKTITATAIMQLIERGYITLQTRLSEWIDELPSEYIDVTVEQALSHRSGIISYREFYNFREDPVIDNNRVLRILIENPKSEFPPGTSYSYSNSNFILLAHLIERITGDSYAHWVQENILDVVKMESTIIYDDVEKIINDRAWGYKGPEGWLMDIMEFRYTDGKKEPTGITTVGSGGIYSNTKDLVSFSRALINDRLVSAKSRADMFGPRSSLPDEGFWDVKNIGYGLGWETATIDGNLIMGHQGGNAGHSAQLIVVPEKNIVVVVLANSSNFDEIGLATKLTKKLLEAE